MNKRNKRIFVVSAILCGSLVSACYAGDEAQLDAMEACLGGLATGTIQDPELSPARFDAEDDRVSVKHLPKPTQAIDFFVHDEEEVDPEVGDALAVVVEVPENNRDNYFFVNRVITQAISGADIIYHSYTMQNLILPLIVTSVGGFIGFKVFAS